MKLILAQKYWLIWPFLVLFLATLLPVNFTLASLNLRTLTAKNVWTGLMSTLAPICFVDKDKIKDHISKSFSGFPVFPGSFPVFPGRHTVLPSTFMYVLR